MAAHYSTEYYAATGTMPMPVPQGGKNGSAQYPYYSGGDSTYSVSPPEGDSPSVSSGSAGAGTYSSVGYHSASSYAGSSAGDYGDGGSNASASNVDLQEYMQERFAQRFNPLPLDHSVAKQAKTSGKLNSRAHDLKEMKKKTAERLARNRARFAEAKEDFRQTREDLEYITKKTAKLEVRAQSKHSKEYEKARARYPSPDSDEY